MKMYLFNLDTRKIRGKHFALQKFSDALRVHLYFDISVVMFYYQSLKTKNANFFFVVFYRLSLAKMQNIILPV